MVTEVFFVITFTVVSYTQSRQYRFISITKSELEQLCQVSALSALCIKWVKMIGQIGRLDPIVKL